MQAVMASLAESRHVDGALLPVLHGVQRRVGHIPRDAKLKLLRERRAGTVGTK